MAEITSHAPGAFCWPELSTTDETGAARFYTRLFGWEAHEQPLPQGRYTLLRLQGKDVAALYGRDPREEAQGVPPHWNTYIGVANADDAARQAAALGGTVVAAPFDVPDAGRMAILQDPTGATFCVWQPGRHTGVGRINEPGALCWCELLTRDTVAATRFYSGLFGWTTKTAKVGGGEYTEWMNGGVPIGGMMAMLDTMDDVPPHWLVYFAVTDCDLTASDARAHDGAVLVPPTDISNAGRFAVLQDPQGASFAVIRPQDPAPAPGTRHP